MASQLMKSVSGIRGVVGETFTPELIQQMASAFAKYANYGKIIVGRDSRPTGKYIAMQLKSILAMNGCDVIDIGIVPTPTVELVVREYKADGGIVISASHNPIEWNAFKLINSTGRFLNEKEIKRYFKIMDDRNFKPAKWNGFGKVYEDLSAVDMHVKRVLEIVDVKRIKRQKFKVVLDSVNGAGSIVTQQLLKKMGCQVIPINCDLSGNFVRGAEPVPENLSMLADAVLKNRADIGFAQDPDADRLAIVDNNAVPIGEERTISIVTEHILSQKKGDVVINLSTTRAVEEIAKNHECKVFRTKVGEINVVDKMVKIEALLGGEGNGGVISPEINMGRDSLAGIGYILEMMAQRKETLSEINKSIPEFVMKKGKVSIKNKKIDNKVFEKIAKEFPGEKISKLDGLRIDFRKNKDFNGGWVHLRSSNTEPIFRIISEGIDEKQADAIYRYFARYFK